MIEPASSSPRVPVAVRLARRAGIHYAWVVVGLTFVLLLIGAGVRSAPGVLIKPWEEDFGWSRGDISLALSLSILTLGSAGPISGKVIEKYGLRASVLLFLSLSTTGVILSTFISSLWQLHVFWGILVGFGTGGVSIVLSAAVANAWFESKRGLVTGLLGGASSAGQFIFLLLLEPVHQHWSWHAAIWVLGIGLLVVALPLSFLLLRSKPADVGLDLYRAKGVAPAPVSAFDQRITPIGAAIRTGDFWLISLSFSICGFTTIGLVGTHFIPHATEHGFTESQAVNILAVMGLMNIVGTTASGYLTDRYDPRKLLMFYYSFRAASLIALPMIDTVPLMSLFAVVFGLDFIATVPPTVMLVANRFGRRSVPTIYGWVSFSHMVGGAIAAALAGQIHDVAGDYAMAIYLAGFFGLVAGALAWRVSGLKATVPQPAAAQPAGGG